MSTPHRSDPDLIVLHALRCVGVAGADRVTTAAGMSRDQTVQRLQDLASRRLAALDPGPFGGWSLTELGRSTAQEWLEAELDLTDARTGVQRSYESFLGLNPQLLQICTDWQMRRLGSAHVVNDHTDADYDNAVLSRLIQVDDSVQHLCRNLSTRLSRFSGYGPRLGSALDRSLAGATEHVSDSLDSYHSVWFQLHEDLLVTLGISRGDERRGSAAD